MKIYGVSTTRNGAITNNNYTNISPTGQDAGLNYHYWYPVDIPSGTNSLFTGLTTAQVDAIVTPYSINNADNTPALVQERMILIHNDSPQPKTNVKIFISDQQLTGGVAEITPWNLAGTEEIQGYSSIEPLTTIPTDYRVDKVYFKANYLTNSQPEVSKIINTAMSPWGWYAAALRLFVVRDQAVEEDFCIIATETT